MILRRLLPAALLLTTIALLPAAQAEGRDHDRDRRHVLLISIDGMHAVDYENCVASNTCPHLAALGQSGVNYTRTTTSRPSDSFPGLMALVTGGSPKTVGAFYDVAYDRVLAPPATTTGNGLAGGTCTAGVINGTQTEYEEGDEINQTLVNGGGPYSTFDGGVLSIDPNKLVRDPFNSCLPVYPWNFVRTNTIYGVIHAAGGYTAWSDKHPVYAVVSGPTGTSSPSNVDDYYAPEVNSNVVNIPNFKTANGVDCSHISNNTSGDWTTDFDSIKCYDQLKVNAVVNWINGKTHLGGSSAPVPAIFGMNFQAVSVGEKLIEKINGVKTFGGYTDAAGDPTPSMLSEIQFVDAAIGQMVAALKSRHLLDSTTITGGIVAKDLTGAVDPPHVIHSYGDLYQGALNLQERLRAKVEVVDLVLDVEPPYVASAGCDLNQRTADLQELVCAVVESENGLRRVDAPDFIGMAIVLIAGTDRNLLEGSTR